MNTIPSDTLDVRDIIPGETYYVVADPNRGGRYVMHPNYPMFHAAWRSKGDARRAAKMMGIGFVAVKTIKY